MWLTEVLPRQAPGVLQLPDQPVWIGSLAYDSRQVRARSLFFCVPGAVHDGHSFASQAAAAGAAALVVARPLPIEVPQVLVTNVRDALATAAVRFHHDPTSRLSVVGVTGTNGKTTTAFIVKALLDAIGHPSGLIGTVKCVIGESERPAVRTTPEATDLQAAFAAMLQAGQTSCAIEVSSHALALRRTQGVRFAAAIFTNLTHDHLDFHRSMEDYFQAKRLLFLPDHPCSSAAPLADRAAAEHDLIGPGGVGRRQGASEPRGHALGGPFQDRSSQPSGTSQPSVSVLNASDPYGRRLLRELPQAVTFGIDCDADYSAHHLTVSASGTTAQISTPVGQRHIRIPVPGRFNLANALGALAAVHQLHGQIDALLQRIEEGVLVPGRFQSVSEGQDFSVIVDYAHTPDSLRSVLQAIAELSPRRIICVVGAGGDRDAAKRPEMGRIGASLSQLLIVTSDNPRSEDPQAIVDQVLSGAREARPRDCEVTALLDRRAAIHHAISVACARDVVLIAGKGHEQGQELADGVKVPFDDVAVAREALFALAGGGHASAPQSLGALP